MSNPNWYIDAHCDTLTEVAAGKGSLLERSTVGHVDLPRLREGNVGLQVMAIWTTPQHYGMQALYQALKVRSVLDQACQQAPDQLHWVLNRQDLTCLGEKTGVLLALENGAPLLEEIWLLDTLFDLGVRMIGLTWNGRNAIADGLKTAGQPSGLTDFGFQVVRRMHEKQIIVDLAHIAEPGFWEVARMGHPFVVTHANARHLCDHPRNMTDEQLHAIAACGGVIGATFVPSFLKVEGQTSIEDLLNHVEYMAEKIGVEHVGIGSDYDGIDNPPTGLHDATCFPAIAQGLAARGWREDDIAQVMRENWLRFFRTHLPG